ncbi:MAG: universal stress protein [Chloroflexi bacterium]|nr:universal stress protein [Chloroflexota bacterium]
MYKKILVPLDGSELAECALAHVKTLYKKDDPPEVILVRAVEPISIPYGREAAAIISMEQLKALETHSKAEAEGYLKATTDRLAKAGISARAAVVYGRAADAIGDFATKNTIDLVVIATHGRSGISRLAWGSVADRLLHSLRIPILMVQAPGCGPLP